MKKQVSVQCRIHRTFIFTEAHAVIMINYESNHSHSIHSFLVRQSSTKFINEIRSNRNDEKANLHTQFGHGFVQFNGHLIK